MPYIWDLCLSLPYASHQPSLELSQQNRSVEIHSVLSFALGRSTRTASKDSLIVQAGGRIQRGWERGLGRWIPTEVHSRSCFWLARACRKGKENVSLWPLNCGAVNKNWKGIGGGSQEARGVSGNGDCESSSAWVTLSQLCKSQLDKFQRDPNRSGRLRPTYCVMVFSPAFIDLFRKKQLGLMSLMIWGRKFKSEYSRRSVIWPFSNQHNH